MGTESELPLRVLVWRDAEGRVWVSYEESAVIGRVQRNNQPSV